jgi:hypothetical protein
MLRLRLHGELRFKNCAASQAPQNERARYEASPRGRKRGQELLMRQQGTRTLMNTSQHVLWQVSL